MNITKRFLDQIEDVAKKEIPDSVMKRAKTALLDYICVTLAGVEYQKEKIKNYIEFAEPEPGECTVIGLGRKLSLKEAVFMNGLNGHALDFDDGTNAGIIHLGSPVFSVLLPLAEKYECSFKDLLRAAVIGYETSFTMACSMQPDHKLMGYHATGTCGILGAVTAIAYLLGFDKAERECAFATACVSASGMLKVLDGGSELKPYNVAKTALFALISAQMAKAGFSGHPDALAGERGYLKMMTGKEDVKIKEPLLNGTYAIMKAYVKPYAACRYCHPAIEAAIKIGRMVEIEKIETILVRTYFLAVNKHDHTEVPGPASAKMSIPYGIAVGLLFGKAGLAEYNEDYVKNEKIKKIMRKVRVVSDEEMTRAFPTITAAVVEVSMASGEMISEHVEHPKGEPENPFSQKEFKERFETMCLYAGKELPDVKRIYTAIWEKEESVSSFMKLL